MRTFSLVLAATCWILHAAALLAADEPEKKSAAEPIQFGPTDWPWWRGPTRDGATEVEQAPPLHWSETQNVVWKSPVPGVGHGSPTVLGDRVFLATAQDESQTQSILCYDRRSGKQRWRTDVHRGTLTNKGNRKSSHASSTPATDGKRVFINFLNDGAIYTTALDIDGARLWQKKICDFDVHQGFGSSPAVYGPLVIVSADNKGGGSVAALDRVTGDFVWKHERPKLPNYTSPIILKAGGREQVVMIGCDLVSAFDPLSGSKLWEAPGATTECVASPVTDGVRIFTTGGYPKNHVSAVRADGSGTTVWENGTRVYVPSMIAYDGHLYGVTDSGVAYCWNSATGDEVWKGRLGGTFSASLIRCAGNITAVNESGRTFTFRAKPEEFRLLAENQLGEEVFATPVICGKRIFLRVASHQDGERRETLYCIGDDA